MRRFPTLRFALLETLLAVGIALLLIGLVFQLLSSRSGAKASASNAMVKTLELALGSYKDSFGYWPQAVTAGFLYLDDVDPSSSDPAKRVDRNFSGFVNYELLKAKFSKTDGVRTWLCDGFGNPLVYRCPGYFNRAGFDLGSLGPDGRLGLGGNLFDPSASEDAPGGYKALFGTGDDETNFSR